MLYLKKSTLSRCAQNINGVSSGPGPSLLPSFIDIHCVVFVKSCPQTNQLTWGNIKNTIWIYRPGLGTFRVQNCGKHSWRKCIAYLQTLGNKNKKCYSCTQLEALQMTQVFQPVFKTFQGLDFLPLKFTNFSGFQSPVQVSWVVYLWRSSCPGREHTINILPFQCIFSLERNPVKTVWSILTTGDQNQHPDYKSLLLLLTA